MNSIPKVLAIVAVTLDGKIARSTNHPSDWTSPEDKIVLRKLISETEAIIIGHTTYLLHESRLAKRQCIVFTRGVVNTKRVNENLLLYNPEGLTPMQKILEPYRSIALLGGSQIYSYFFDHGLVDEIHLTIEPVIFGEGLDFLRSKGPLDTQFQLVSMEKLNPQGAVYLHYRKK
jgi:dihydrofolate reductase